MAAVADAAVVAAVGGGGGGGSEGGGGTGTCDAIEFTWWPSLLYISLDLDGIKMHLRFWLFYCIKYIVNW